MGCRSHYLVRVRPMPELVDRKSEMVLRQPSCSERKAKHNKNENPRFQHVFHAPIYSRTTSHVKGRRWQIRSRSILDRHGWSFWLSSDEREETDFGFATLILRETSCSPELVFYGCSSRILQEEQIEQDTDIIACMKTLALDGQFDKDESSIYRKSDVRLFFLRRWTKLWRTSGQLNSSIRSPPKNNKCRCRLLANKHNPRDSGA